jgi:hypothetical protein
LAAAQPLTAAASSLVAFEFPFAMSPRLLAATRDQAAALGLNLFGLVDAERFDRSQSPEQRAQRLEPRCGTILVLGSGGRAFAQRLARTIGSDPSPAAAEQHGWHSACHIAAALQGQGVPGRAVALDLTCRLPIARLGEAAGFGTVSPVSGMLLHPEYGPWLRLRAALLLDGKPFGACPDASIADSFQPCCNCPRPCVPACPAEAHDGHGQADLKRCATHRHEGGCAVGCCSRGACPVGSEHRDAPDEAAHGHAFHLPVLQRWFGLGVWRVVPSIVRQGR